MARLFRTVEHLGGNLDKMFGGLIHFYLPQGTHSNIEEQITAITDELRSNPGKVDSSCAPTLRKLLSLTFDLSGEDRPV